MPERWPASVACSLSEYEAITNCKIEERANHYAQRVRQHIRNARPSDERPRKCNIGDEGN